MARATAITKLPSLVSIVWSPSHVITRSLTAYGRLRLVFVSDFKSLHEMTQVKSFFFNFKSLFTCDSAMLKFLRLAVVELLAPGRDILSWLLLIVFYYDV